MTKLLLKTIPVFLLVAAAACSFTKGRGLAEAGVTRFHDQYNSGQFREIYNQSAPGFKESGPEAVSVEFFEALKKKLGEIKHANQTGWHINTTPAGTMVTLGYDVEFTEGKGTEQFVFVVNGNQALLYKYNVNSPLLITR